MLSVEAGDEGKSEASSASPPPPSPPSSSGHETWAVMRVLRRHVLLSLLDVSAVVATFFLCSSAGVVLSYAMKFLFSFWIPLLVVKGNFRQLDGVVGSFVRDKLGL